MDKRERRERREGRGRGEVGEGSGTEKGVKPSEES